MEVSHHAEMFRCETCSWGRHCDESNPAPFPKFVIHKLIESRTCFLPMITPQSRFLLGLYRHYQAKLLPCAGGLLDQPNYYVQAMEILGEADQRIQAEALERARRDTQHSLH